MTTLDCPPISLLLGAIKSARRFRCRTSIFASPPRYRVLRAVARVRRVPALHHPGLHALMTAFTRSHSSWSRA